jgi:hypothetical protein
VQVQRQRYRASAAKFLYPSLHRRCVACNVAASIAGTVSSGVLKKEVQLQKRFLPI